MLNEYKGIINKSIINSYSEILVIDIIDDKKVIDDCKFKKIK